MASPPVLAALALLLLNDFVLKARFHNAITGKLSDFAGLIVFAAFWMTLLPRWRGTVLLAVAAAFAAWKSPLSQPAIDAWNAGTGWPVQRVVDWTDLVALCVLVPLWSYGPRWRAHRALRPAAALLSVFAFAATSQLPPQSDVPLAESFAFDDDPDALVARMYSAGMTFERGGRGRRLLSGQYMDPMGNLTIGVPPMPGSRDELPVLFDADLQVRPGGSVLRLIRASHASRAELSLSEVRARFEREVAGPLRGGAVPGGPVRRTAGDAAAFQAQVFSPWSLDQPLTAVQVYIDQPAHVALIEISGAGEWRVIYPSPPLTANERDPERLLAPGSHVLFTGCGTVPERVASTRTLPVCTSAPLRSRPGGNDGGSTRSACSAILSGTTRLLLITAGHPLRGEVLRAAMDGRCGGGIENPAQARWMGEFLSGAGAGRWGAAQYDLYRPARSR